MPPKPSNAELQLKVVQRNYESISKLMHGKQQECEKLELELEGVKRQLLDAAELQQQAASRADSAEGRIKDLEAKLQDESSLLKSLQRANLEAAAAAQQQSALKQHVIQLSDKLEAKSAEVRRFSKDYEGACVMQDAGLQTLEALKVQYEALKALSSNTQAQLQSTKAQLHHAEAASLQAQQRILQAEMASKEQQHSAEVAAEDCQRLRQEVEELKLNSSTTLTELQAAKVQDELLHSQLRASKRAVECEKDENQALRQQLLSWQSDVASHKQQNKRLQEDNQRLQSQMLATGERLESMAQDASLDLSKEVLKLQRQLAVEEKRASDDRTRADLQCQQLQGQVHSLQLQQQEAQAQVADAHRLRLDAYAAADAAIQAADKRLAAVGGSMEQRMMHAQQRMHALLGAAHHNCGGWVAMVDLIEQGISGLSAALGVLRVTALNQKQKGEATKPMLAMLEQTIADLQAQLAGEQKSHQLTQEAMARQAPTYASHINQIRQQAQQETAQEQDRLRGQLARMQAEMQQLQACCDADRQATKELMEVEKIQFNRQLERGQVQRLQLQQELAAQQVQTQQRLAQLGEAAHRDQALQTQVKDMLTDARDHLAHHVGLSLEFAEGIAGDTIALEERLHSTGIVKSLHSVFPPSTPDAKLSDADKAMLLPKLLSHARLHLLYVAEQLQENLAAPEAQGTSSSSKAAASVSLSEQEQELRATVSKLVHTEQAQEALYTCMACVQLLKNPVACTPCGHTFCYGCLMRAKVNGDLVCPECNNLPITGYVQNRSLEGLVTKYEYRLGALMSLQRMLR